MIYAGTLLTLNAFACNHTFFWSLFGFLGTPLSVSVRKWKQVVLHTTFQFKVLDGPKEEMAESISIRERYVSSYEALSRSAYTRILEVISFRKARDPAGNQSAAEIARQWTEAVNMSSSGLSEKVNEGFVKMAVKLWDKLLSDEACRA